jgi:hypothetical protein
MSTNPNMASASTILAQVPTFTQTGNPNGVVGPITITICAGQDTYGTAIANGYVALRFISALPGVEALDFALTKTDAIVVGKVMEAIAASA